MGLMGAMVRFRMYREKRCYLRLAIERTTHTTPMDTTANVANEFGFGPSLDPVEEVEWGWRPVTL
jgi:hypothetical protein